jgi:hypothetical protein
MADDTTKSAEGTEPDFDSTEDEFRAMFVEAERTQAQLLKLANRMSPTSPDVAEAIRQIVGNVLPLIQNLAAACGGAFSGVEEVLGDLQEGAGEEEEESGLEYDDARDFYRVLTANLKLLDDTLAVTDAPEQKLTLETLRTMNATMRDRLPELSGMSLEELQKAADAPDEPEEEEEDEDEEDESTTEAN